MQPLRDAGDDIFCHDLYFAFLFAFAVDVGIPE